MSLDDLVQFSRKRGPGGGGKFSRPGTQRTGKFQQSPNQGGKGVGVGGGAKVSDLRDVLAQKQKSSVGDLRSKLKPKALYTNKFTSKSQPSTPQASSSITPSSSSASRRSANLPKRSQGISPMKPIRVDEPSSPIRSSRRSDPGPISHKQRSALSKLPSYDEAKKITVTVPGMRHPPSSSEVSSKFSTSHPPSLSCHMHCCYWGPFVQCVCAYTYNVCRVNAK